MTRRIWKGDDQNVDEMRGVHEDVEGGFVYPDYLDD